MSKTEIPGDYQFQALQKGPRMQRFWHRNKINVMQNVMQLSHVDVIVDMGCGSGNLLFNVSKNARLGVGVDISESALQFCNGLSQKTGTRSAFVCGFGDHIPLPDNFADVVFLVEVIEHLTHPNDVLREILRILKVGGRLFLTTPNYTFPSLWPLLEWVADRSGLVPRMAGEQHVQKFGPLLLRDTFTELGYSVDKLGTFYRLSPFVSYVSEPWAEAMVTKEVNGGSLSGSLIYCVASKPPAQRP